MSEQEHDIQPLLDSTDRLLDSLESDKTNREPVKQPHEYKAPPEVQAKIDSDHAEWERLDKQGIRTMAEQRRQVGGSFKTSEEVENDTITADEITRDAARKARILVGDEVKKAKPTRSKPRFTTGIKGQIADGDKRVKDQHDLI